MTQPHSYLEQYLEQVKAQIAQIQEMLDPLLSGRMWLRSRREGDSDWKDDTEATIEWHKRNIALYERIADAIKKQLGH
ncbi:MAG: hypothetical protein E6G97_23855 [Alphaproteobacteria bacterium]|nr:MAG: hypothetical protein E6G97_23855 [Alphaproteobacteria bacterium]